MTQDDDDANDDFTAELQVWHWPLGQISLKKKEKKSKQQLQCTIPLPYMCQQQICPMNAKGMLHMPISSCV